MLKNTVTGSLLAKILPATVAKHFLENASQDDVNKAEQEAAVLHQQMQSIVPPAGVAVASTTGGTVPTTPVAPTAQGSMPLEIPAPTGELTNQLTAMTTRATTAEASVTSLTSQLATANNELTNYKAWYQKIVGQGTSLPAADASNRGQAAQVTDQQLSLASADALAMFQSRKARA